jgi:multiple antibiotic resistance protein
MDPLGNVPIGQQVLGISLESLQVAGALSVVLALAAVLVVVYLSMRYASGLGRLLRDREIDLLSRVMGLLVAAIAVQLVASAVETWIRSGVR